MLVTHPDEPGGVPSFHLMSVELMLTRRNLCGPKSADSVAQRTTVENALGYAKSLQSSLPQAPCLMDNRGREQVGVPVVRVRKDGGLWRSPG